MRMRTMKSLMTTMRIGSRLLLMADFSKVGGDGAGYVLKVMLMVGKDFVEEYGSPS